MCDVLEIAEILEAEGVSVPKSNGANRGDACMPDDESLPLPRCRGKTQEVTNEDTVRSSMRNKGNLFAGILNVPQRKLTLDAVDASVREKLSGSGMDTGDKVTYRFAALKTVPSIGSVALQFLTVRLDRHFRRGAMPRRFPDLLEKGLDYFGSRLLREERCSSLTCTQERGNIDVVEVLFS